MVESHSEELQPIEDLDEEVYEQARREDEEYIEVLDCETIEEENEERDVENLHKFNSFEAVLLTQLLSQSSARFQDVPSALKEEFSSQTDRDRLQSKFETSDVEVFDNDEDDVG